MILAIAVSSVMAYLLSQRLQKTILDPILALADTAGNISHQHDYTVRAKKFDNDEIGGLTDAFNQMLDQIEAQNAEITSFSHDLEKKVDERTTELNHANSELKLKSEFVETIIDSTVDVIAVFDTQLNFVILNKYGREIYGVKDDILGRNIFDVFPQVKNSPMYDDLQRALKGEKVYNPKYMSRVSNRILENFYVPLLDKDNKVYSLLVIGHDITDTTEANEKLLLLNKELEKSNRDLEQFAFVASHDLQEPLRKIQTFSHLIESKIDYKETTRKYIEKVISSAMRMTELIKSVLNYSRLSNENEGFAPVDLNQVVENIRSDYELTIAEKQAIIEVDELPVLPGNQLQLNQLFLNLISNSLKFSEVKPVISITSRIVEKSQLTSNGLKGQYAELIFKDNGIGFEQHYADKVFTVFQRLHNKQQYPGTGIGLALCKKIVDNHGGHISVSSRLGEGTTFTIYLPFNGRAVD
jgi:two-component system CheB/CheR fusion protein